MKRFVHSSLAVTAMVLATVASLMASSQSASARPTVYDSTNNGTATVTAGFGAATSTNAIFGDDLTLTSTGTLSNLSLSVFNSDATAGNNITGGTIAINFYRNNGSLPSAATLIGGFNGTFTTSLSNSFYTILNYTNLQTLSTPIVFNTTSIYVTQQFISLTGGSTSAGIVAYATAPTTGSSNASFYLSSTAYSAGNYNLGGNTYLPYVVGTTAVVPEANTLALLGAGLAPIAGIVIARRRKTA